MRRPQLSGRVLGIAIDIVVQLRRSCDGDAAATELRSTSFVALILRVASLGRDAQMMRPAFIFPRGRSC